MKTIGRRVFLKEGFAGALGLAVASGAGLGSLNACSQETEQQLKKAVKAAGSYDVVVVGGGPAGFIAAIAAARQLNGQNASAATLKKYLTPRIPWHPTLPQPHKGKQSGPGSH